MLDEAVDTASDGDQAFVAVIGGKELVAPLGRRKSTVHHVTRSFVHICVCVCVALCSEWGQACQTHLPDPPPPSPTLPKTCSGRHGNNLLIGRREDVKGVFTCFFFLSPSPASRAACCTTPQHVITHFGFITTNISTDSCIFLESYAGAMLNNNALTCQTLPVKIFFGHHAGFF